MGRPAIVLLLAGCWLAVIAASALALLGPDEGDGFLRGFNRVMAFVQWQIGAGLLAVLIWAAGRGLAPVHTVRRLSILPLALAGLMLLGLVGLIGYAALITG